MDVFLELNGKEEFTMQKTNRYEGWRPDKIITPQLGMTIKPISIKIVGKFSIPEFHEEECTKVSEDGMVRTPSDHMALICDFIFTQ